MLTLEENLGPEWAEVLSPVFNESWMQTIAQRVLNQGDKIRPGIENIFNAYRSTPPSKIKVVICGQDPYPGNEAHGLAFSSQQAKIPPSLRIIFKELERTGFGTRTNPNLQDWADQGVFLLNSILTTTYQIPAAHKTWGWQKFTGLTLQHIGTLQQPIVFMAWGQFAGILIGDHFYPETSGPRLVLNACHPQAENYSGGRTKFVGCGHFEKANFFFTSLGESPIKWV